MVRPQDTFTRRLRMIAIILGVLAGIIALISALSAFAAVGGDAAYSTRLWAAWAGLILAVLAGAAALFITTRPIAASIIMLISGIAGFVCMNLFYINTWYVLAIPLWIIAAALGAISARRLAS